MHISNHCDALQDVSVSNVFHKPGTNQQLEDLKVICWKEIFSVSPEMIFVAAACLILMSGREPD